MIFKEADDKSQAIETLEALQTRSDISPTQRKALKKEFFIMKSGVRGEKEAAYQIDFLFKDSKNYAVIHDLRIVVNDRIAQIDHLIITRAFDVFMIETKNFSSGIKITNIGEFMSWNNYFKQFEGIPSPIAQNEQHRAVLTDFFKITDGMPRTLGMKISPSISSLIMISNSARIDRPPAKAFDTSKVIKCEALAGIMKKYKTSVNISHIFISISRKTLANVAELIIDAHQPLTIDYEERFGLPKATLTKTPQAHAPAHAPSNNENRPVDICKKCKGNNTTLTSGRFGYYFKCNSCKANTAIKLTCKTNSCKPKIRKAKLEFFKDCKECGTSELFWTNTAKS